MRLFLLVLTEEQCKQYLRRDLHRPHSPSIRTRARFCCCRGVAVDLVAGKRKVEECQDDADEQYIHGDGLLCDSCEFVPLLYPITPATTSRELRMHYVSFPPGFGGRRAVCPAIGSRNQPEPPATTPLKVLQGRCTTHWLSGSGSPYWATFASHCT